MSLNKFMHSRNRYKYQRPNFGSLAQKYPAFKQYLTENHKGKLVLDFQNSDAVRMLTVCLLKEDYGFNIEIPPDRLIPTLPLRLNYVHWIEDITKDWNRKELSAIDIGTGACCIYPILATSSNPWRFLATEADDVNFAYALKNLESNNLMERIKVVKVNVDTILEGVIGTTEEVYDFCMCNPPFFADHLEAQGLVSRTASRPEPKTMSTASPQEGIVQGGEISFVRRLIEESNFLQQRIRVYTTMLGKKASLPPLKEILRRCKIENFASTEFCQGKTMRWGLSWTFDKSVKFPKSEFSLGRKEGKKSLIHVIPTQFGERRDQVADLVSFFKGIFSQLRIHCRGGRQTKFFALMTLTAEENTWIHTRRKRRQTLRELAAKRKSDRDDSEDEDTPATTQSSEAPAFQEEKAREGALAITAKGHSDVDTTDSLARKTEKGTHDNTNKKSVPDKDETETNFGTDEDMGVKRKIELETHIPAEVAPTKRLKKNNESCALSEDKEIATGCTKAKVQASCDDGRKESVGESDVCAAIEEAMCSSTPVLCCEEEEVGVSPSSQVEVPVLKCHACVRVQGGDLALELTWLDGRDIQLMHQLMQFIKNRLAARTPTKV